MATQTCVYFMKTDVIYCSMVYHHLVWVKHFLLEAFGLQVKTLYVNLSTLIDVYHHLCVIKVHTISFW